MPHIFISYRRDDAGFVANMVSLRDTIRDQDGADHLVEVLFAGLHTIKAKISVDGVHIGGDSF